MKNIFYTIAILLIILSSCVNKSNKNTDSHVHEDGTEHVNHENGSVTTPQQESFEVEIDSLANINDTLKREHKTEQSHEDGHEHTH